MTENTGAKGGKVGAFFRRIGSFIKRHKVLTVVLVILVILGIFIFNAIRGVRNVVANLAQTPQTLTLERMALEQIVAGEGTVQSATARQVGTALTSKITEVYVKEGDYVNEGDVLCQLDTTDIDKNIADAKKEIAKAQAADKINLEAAQRRLNDAINQYSADEANYNRKIQEAGDAINQARANAGYAAGNAAMETEASDAAKADAAVVAAQTALTTAQTDLVAKQEDLAAKQRLLADKQATLATAQAEYEAALASGNNPTGPVDISSFEAARDKALNDVNAAQAEVDSAQVAVNDAQANVASAQGPYDTAYRSAYETFKNNNPNIYNDAYNNAYNSADVSALQSAYDTAVETRDSVLRTDNATIASAREALATQKLVDSASAQKTQLESYEKQKEESTITAPVSGTIVEIAAEVGLSPSAAVTANATAAAGSVSAGATTSLFTIKDEGSLEILVSVPEYDAVSLSLNLPVTITSDALTGEEWSGIVTNISPAATDANSNFSVTITVTSAVEKLAIGMSAKVNIITDSETDVFAVPYDAVTTNAQGESVVYALDASAGQGQSGAVSAPVQAPPSASGTAAPQGRPIVVETGMETDYYIEISGDGLAEGMTLLADPEGKNVNTANNFGIMMGPGGGF